MYENKNTLQFRPEYLTAALDLMKNEISPLLRRQIGLLNLCFVPNQHNHTITIITMWKSQAQAYAIETSCDYCRRVDQLEQYLRDSEPLPVVAPFHVYIPIKALIHNFN